MSKEKVEEYARDDYVKYQEYFNLFSKDTSNKYEDIGFYECYVKTLFFKNWKDGLNSINVFILNEILEELHQDVNSAYYLSSIGLYRTSNMHLRSMIELSFQVIYFFEHPVEFEKWKQGNFIIKHDKLIVYIKEHPRFSNNDIKYKVGILVDQISKEWKIYSKHIHAESLDYFQTKKESECSKGFVVSEFNKWKTHYLVVTTKVNDLLLLFFHEEIKLFPSNNKDLLKLELSEK